MTTVKLLVSCVVLLTGCMVGGGPVVGYGGHGWFAGAEVSAGGEIILPQATLGYQSDQKLVYLRADEAIDVTAMQRPAGLSTDYGSFVRGGRIGGGIGWSFATTEPTTQGVFAVGASLGHAFLPLNHGDSGNGCGVANNVGVVELQLRYAAGWSVVLAPRVEYGSTLCN